jgi:hypothetical protein
LWWPKAPQKPHSYPNQGKKKNPADSDPLSWIYSILIDIMHFNVWTTWMPAALARNPHINTCNCSGCHGMIM